MMRSTVPFDLRIRISPERKHARHLALVNRLLFTQEHRLNTVGRPIQMTLLAVATWKPGEIYYYCPPAFTITKGDAVCGW
jgi:hypothetical protein